MANVMAFGPPISLTAVHRASVILKMAYAQGNPLSIKKMETYTKKVFIKKASTAASGNSMTSKVTCLRKSISARLNQNKLAPTVHSM